MRGLSFALLMISLAGSAHAANMETRPLGAGLPDMILVYGELTLSDADRFKAIAEIPAKAIVAFAGPGGSVVAGTAIGEVIRLKNFDTVVLDGDQCASACALAWLGGTRRYLGQGAMIGFHAARNVQSGEVSGIGNALVGAYLNKIGLQNRAIVCATAAAPNSIFWLDLEHTTLCGIDVSLLAVPSTTAGASAEKNGRARTSLEAEAVDFVVRHAASESALASLAIQTVRTHYSDMILYYGKHLDRAAVMKEYQTFVERWPERKYEVRQETAEVQCFPGSQVCNVTATIDWMATRLPRGKKSVGSSTWSLGLVRSHGSFLINSVNGAVLKREITDIPGGAVGIEPDFAARAFGQR